jgi:Uma2 family endonuclease
MAGILIDSSTQPPERLFTAADLAFFPTDLPSGSVDFELESGRLVVVVPPGHMHGSVQARITTELGIQGERAGFGRVFTEVGIVLTRNPDSVLAPDVVFVVNSNLPVRESPEGYLETIPDLVVEVRSKNDSRGHLDRKVAEYIAVGVRLVWVVDPETRSVAAHRGDRGPHVFLEADTVTIDDVVPGFHVAVGDIFRD